MAERKVYVYRLDVVYPEGSHVLGWEPQEWDGWADDIDPRCETTIYFHWPSVKLYLSQGAAKRRADLLRGYGATVDIVRSMPVEWKGQDSDG